MSKLINSKVLEIIKKKSEQEPKKSAVKQQQQLQIGASIEHLDGEDFFYRSSVNDVRFHFQKKKSACKIYCFKDEQKEKLVLLLTAEGYKVESKFVDGFCYELTINKK